MKSAVTVNGAVNAVRACALLWLSALWLAFAPSSLAHHAAQAQFDVETVKQIEGKLVKIELINPHPQLYLEVAAALDGASETVEWRVEAPSIAVLRRVGIFRALRVGDNYKIDYWPSRDGSPIALMQTLTDSTGKSYGAVKGRSY